ncbi:hypothetical protein ABFS82_07G048400 [Erythranthe guttata]|uniref:RING-type domain-containing protein n=2 Tax=Erythranthe guttata TaxID=4155 RepID=A0A022PRB9_ERYGU|nr:PREDICTED: putative E3 ubiquitin-protein ligase XBAT35 [Erythranthe guttata]EYU18316.1 hypothetical protein MIMGU_mgv1a006609mg [Erythranthe guttata]|eukprot:XP_012828576.1 PREDICTED: putative E3 ubiquitin-protein ligase XBAT35 [Erythranthe guttata]
MGLQQSKDELLYEKVNSGSVEEIKSLRRDGAGLEWIDKEGKTPLIVACMNPQLYNVANTLIELGANVNAYRPGRQAGTPLHHAAKRGLEQTLKLLLSHGANAMVMNDDCQTPLDVARSKGYTNIVRAIEGHLCLFSGWLRELHGPSILELLAPQFLSRKVWVAILPCGSRNPRKPFRLELAIYGGPQDGQPRTIIPLWKANLEEPNFNQPDPVAIISDVSKIPRRWRKRREIKSCQEARRTRIRLAPVHESEKQQLQRFCNACKGIPQAMHPLVPPSSQVHAASASASAPPISENEELNIATNASNGSKCEVLEAEPAGGPAQHFRSQITTPQNPSVVVSTASAPPAANADVDYDDGQVHYPAVNTSSLGGAHEKNNEESDTNSSCTICLDAPLEGACVPCGHLAGCMSCLNEIKSKKWGCPVCRAEIDQVIRIYAV